MNGGSINGALNQLKQIALTPMLPLKGDLKTQEISSPAAEIDPRLNSPPSDVSLSEPDLPSQFTRVMGKGRMRSKLFLKGTLIKEVLINVL